MGYKISFQGVRAKVHHNPIKASIKIILWSLVILWINTVICYILSITLEFFLLTWRETILQGLH
jgi:hypothetical protein